ncbi:hypothetical protein GVK47_02960 [Salmonella enterica subsp. houtenae serovar 43:z4,z32:-]|nr:hypothetical protein [Salmonella enterica subsp. houtenae serovar 43:z4,z32:-]NBA90151.1 hypothetical protein [Salmonella enterica subsp. houtenae serovar 43:z4,z32:-]NBA99604.1 hypothetical protein [Salmonella enterica subsp. houtenae serovar 43:z4,z32:-]
MTPYIQALIAMTSDKLQQRMQKDPTSASDSLLFMGNQHDTVPRRLLQDPLLSPRDKFAWQVIGVTNGAKVIHIRRLKSDPEVNLLS